MKNKFSVFSHSGDGCKSILRNENDVKCISEQDPNQTMSRGKAHRVINALTQMRRDQNIKSYKVLNGGFRISTRRSRVPEAHHTASRSQVCIAFWDAGQFS